jgi:hypothetical protein
MRILFFTILFTLRTTASLVTGENILEQGKPAIGRDCEGALTMIDTAAVDAMNNPEAYVIAIARLGNRETSRVLNQQRLTDVMYRLNEKTRNRAVGASGRRFNGPGRVELYVNGRLLYVIEYSRNRRIDCRGCRG